MLTVKRTVTASFDVDPQHGFPPLCPDELSVPEGDQIAEELNAQARCARLLLVSKDCHPTEAPWMAAAAEEIMQPISGDYPSLDIKWPPHCVVGTAGNRLISGLPAEDDYDLVIEKGQDPLMRPYGACFKDLKEEQRTGVLEWLRREGTETVLVGGLATDFYVKTIALQLRRVGFRVLFNLSGCRGVAEESSRQVLDELQQAEVEQFAGSAELVAND